jgi:hypothetical protein
MIKNEILTWTEVKAEAEIEAASRSAKLSMTTIEIAVRTKVRKSDKKVRNSDKSFFFTETCLFPSLVFGRRNGNRVKVAFFSAFFCVFFLRFLSIEIRFLSVLVEDEMKTERKVAGQMEIIRRRSQITSKKITSRRRYFLFRPTFDAQSAVRRRPSTAAARRRRKKWFPSLSPSLSRTFSRSLPVVR